MDNVIQAFFGDHKQQRELKEDCAALLKERAGLDAEGAERLSQAIVEEFVKMRDMSSGITATHRPGVDPVESWRMDMQDFLRRIRELQGSSFWRIVWMAIEEGKNAAQ